MRPDIVYSLVVKRTVSQSVVGSSSSGSVLFQRRVRSFVRSFSFWFLSDWTNFFVRLRWRSVV